MSPEPHRHVGQSVVRIGAPLSVLQGPQHDRLGLYRSPQLQEDGGKQSMRRNADDFSLDCTLRERQRIGEAPYAHQTVRPDVCRVGW